MAVLLAKRWVELWEPRLGTQYIANLEIFYCP